MSGDAAKVEVSNLPLTQNGGVRVELIPMPCGDNPWRTHGDYRREQRRETIRFWVTIVSLVVSIISVAATAVIAINALKRVTP